MDAVHDLTSIGVEAGSGVDTVLDGVDFRGRNAGGDRSGRTGPFEQRDACHRAACHARAREVYDLLKGSGERLFSAGGMDQREDGLRWI